MSAPLSFPANSSQRLFEKAHSPHSPLQVERSSSPCSSIRKSKEHDDDGSGIPTSPIETDAEQPKRPRYVKAATASEVATVSQDGTLRRPAVCECGNVFRTDSEFCRKCGKPRGEANRLMDPFHVLNPGEPSVDTEPSERTTAFMQPPKPKRFSDEEWRLSSGSCLSVRTVSSEKWKDEQSPEESNILKDRLTAGDVETTKTLSTLSSSTSTRRSTNKNRPRSACGDDARFSIDLANAIAAKVCQTITLLHRELTDRFIEDLHEHCKTVNSTSTGAQRWPSHDHRTQAPPTQSTNRRGRPHGPPKRSPSNSSVSTLVTNFGGNAKAPDGIEQNEVCAFDGGHSSALPADQDVYHSQDSSRAMQPTGLSGIENISGAQHKVAPQGVKKGTPNVGMSRAGTGTSLVSDAVRRIRRSIGSASFSAGGISRSSSHTLHAISNTLSLHQSLDLRRLEDLLCNDLFDQESLIFTGTHSELSESGHSSASYSRPREKPGHMDNLLEPVREVDTIRNTNRSTNHGSQMIGDTGVSTRSGSQFMIPGLPNQDTRAEHWDSIVAGAVSIKTNDEMPNRCCGIVSAPVVFLKLCGIIPWKHRTHQDACCSYSYMYQRLIPLILVLSFVHVLVEVISLEEDDAHNSSYTSSREDYILRFGKNELFSDLAMALCSALGLLSLQICGCHGMDECRVILISYAGREKFLEAWSFTSHRSFLITMAIWLASLFIRMYTSGIFSGSLDHVGILTSFAIYTLVLSGLTFCVLDICNGMALMVDSYAFAVAIKGGDPVVAVRSWGVAHAMLRKASGCMQGLIVVFMQCSCLVFLLVILAATQLLHNHEEARQYHFIPTALILLGLLRMFLGAASVTDKCIRVPSLVNSLYFGVDVDMNRQYIIDYIHNSASGIYTFEVLLDSEKVVKVSYLLAVVALYIFTTTMKVKECQ